MTPKSSILNQKLADFGSFEGSSLTILEVEKVIFWIFLKLFWSCLGSVRALFWSFKRQLLGVFSALNIDN